MKFDTKYRIERACSKDEFRPHLTHVELDVETKRVLATNGHFAVSVPCEPTTDDKSGPIPRRAITDARRYYGEADAIIVASDDAIDLPGTVTYRRPKTKFPPAADEIKKAPDFGAEGTVSVTLDPIYLVSIARALGRSGECGTHVTLTFNVADLKQSDDYVRAIGVTVGCEPEAKAALMPARR